jgi:excisionase family DNA binding protein
VQQQGLPGAAASRPAGPAPAAIPELLSPAEVAQALGVSEADVLAIIQSGELAAKKIGSSYRILRSAVDVYLSK